MSTAAWLVPLLLFLAYCCWYAYKEHMDKLDEIARKLDRDGKDNP